MHVAPLCTDLERGCAPELFPTLMVQNVKPQDLYLVWAFGKQYDLSGHQFILKLELACSICKTYSFSSWGKAKFIGVVK